MVSRRQREMRLATDQPDLLELHDELKSLTRQLAQAALATTGGHKVDPQRLGELSARREQLEQQLSERSLTYRSAKQEISLADVRAALPANAALVDYLVFGVKTDRRLLAFVVRPQGPVMLVDLTDAKSLQNYVNTWRESIEHVGDNEVGRGCWVCSEPCKSPVPKP